jgi:hypothetical protein
MTDIRPGDVLLIKKSQQLWKHAKMDLVSDEKLTTSLCTLFFGDLALVLDVIDMRPLKLNELRVLVNGSVGYYVLYNRDQVEII